MAKTQNVLWGEGGLVVCVVPKVKYIGIFVYILTNILFVLFQHAPLDAIVEINAISLACSHLIDNGGEWKVCLVCYTMIMLPFIAFDGMP